MGFQQSTNFLGVLSILYSSAKWESSGTFSAGPGDARFVDSRTSRQDLKRPPVQLRDDAGGWVRSLVLLFDMEHDLLDKVSASVIRSMQ